MLKFTDAGRAALDAEYIHRTGSPAPARAAAHILDRRATEVAHRCAGMWTHASLCDFETLSGRAEAFNAPAEWFTHP